MQEHPSAASERAKISEILSDNTLDSLNATRLTSSSLFIHLSHGLAYTIGSALGSTPPSVETCLTAYLTPNKADLTAGARAWSKHSHRSLPAPSDASDAAETQRGKREASTGWWGTPSGPVASINKNALELFWKVMNAATWRNLHWLPRQILVYEVRVEEGYGMRWSQDQSQGDEAMECHPWIFRGFVEPMMENGHELGWKHS